MPSLKYFLFLYCTFPCNFCSSLVFDLQNCLVVDISSLYVLFGFFFHFIFCCCFFIVWYYLLNRFWLRFCLHLFGMRCNVQYSMTSLFPRRAPLFGFVWFEWIIFYDAGKRNIIISNSRFDSKFRIQMKGIVSLWIETQKEKIQSTLYSSSEYVYHWLNGLVSIIRIRRMA